MKDFTILILEDVLPMRKFLQNYFEKYYNVYTVETVNSAIRLIEKSKNIDLILTDLHLSSNDISGYDFIEYIRSTSFYYQLPIIVVSSTDSSADKIKAFKLGANDYVIKPFNPEELYMRIENLLAVKSKKD